ERVLRMVMAIHVRRRREREVRWREIERLEQAGIADDDPLRVSDTRSGEVGPVLEQLDAIADPPHALGDGDGRTEADEGIEPHITRPRVRGEYRLDKRLGEADVIVVSP